MAMLRDRATIYASRSVHSAAWSQRQCHFRFDFFLFRFSFCIIVFFRIIYRFNSHVVIAQCTNVITCLCECIAQFSKFACIFPLKKGPTPFVVKFSLLRAFQIFFVFVFNRFIFFFVLAFLVFSILLCDPHSAR